ncbi:hypothetical protein ES708_13984 [subsurface metagenome]
MKTKWQLVLFAGLILLLAGLVAGCSTTPAETSNTPMMPTNLSIMVSPPGAGVVSAMIAPSSGGVVSPDYEKEMMTIVPPEGSVYERNTPLMLNATPAEGFTFAYWEGDRFSYWASNSPSEVSSPKTWWLIMNYHKTIIAQFTEVSSPISEVTVSAVTESEADIRWATPPEGYSQIEYGTTENYGSISNRIEGGESHSFKLRKLEPETLCHFRIIFVSQDEVEFVANDYVFTTRCIEELVSVALYPVRTISTGDLITHFGSTLFNDSSQTITVCEMKILDESSNIVYGISESGSMKMGSLGHYSEVPTIAETLGRGRIDTGDSLSMSAWVWEPPLVGREDISEWQAEWYCEAANGEKFTITGKFSSFVDFFNWVTK